MDFAKLKTTLDGGHPVTGAYDADAVIAAGQLNAANMDGETRLTDIMTYLVLTFKDDSSLYGRIQIVADGSVGDSPFGVTLTMSHVTACKAAVATIRSGIDSSFASTNSALGTLVGHVIGSGAVDVAHGVAIQNMSKNLRSHAATHGLGNVRPGEVAMARNV